MNELAVLFFSVFFVGFLADVFLLWQKLDWAADIRLFILVGLWLLIGKMFRLTSIATFKVTLVFLIVLSFLFIFAREHASVERIASWVYIFLAVGVIQQLWESRKK